MNLLAVAEKLAITEKATEVAPVNGIGIAVTGMSIVFFALLLISGFLTVLPKLMEILNEYYPEKIHQAPAASPVAVNNQVEDEIVVAIGAALHQHRST
jgi:sodium pump decarboxylase gamma subunit